MATIQSNALLYSAMEQTLRRAMAENKPVPLKRLFSSPDIHKAARGIQQVRDVISTFKAKDCILAVPINQKENDGAKVAYIWKDGAAFSIGKPKAKPHLKPGPVEKTVFAPPNTKEVELVFQGIEIVVGTNPKTGRIRITIGS